MRVEDSQLKGWQQQLQEAAAPEILAWAASTFGSEVSLASALGAECQVLTHMLAQQKLSIPIFTLDTGRLFPESYALLAQTEARYGVRIRVVVPERAGVEAMVAAHGINLFRDSVEHRHLCCQVRKLEPLARALQGQAAWICGLRQEQSSFRRKVQVVEWDAEHAMVKINPLASWTGAELWRYIHAHKIAYNPLHDQGFPSIGCACCTRAVAPGADQRSGRWWWEQSSHRECGLHLGPQPAR